jgi:hypothetical protein
MRANALQESFIAGASERRMSFRCSAKIVIDAEVHRYVPAAQPYSAAIDQLGGLWLFREAEDVDVERARLVLFASRDRQRNVVDALKRPRTAQRDDVRLALGPGPSRD